jgi:hypothetical protein
MACYKYSLTFLYVDYVRTTEETHVSTTCYGDSFTFLYVDGVRTSEETHVSTTCSDDSLLFTFKRCPSSGTSQETLHSDRKIFFWEV